MQRRPDDANLHDAVRAGGDAIEEGGEDAPVELASLEDGPRLHTVQRADFAETGYVPARGGLVRLEAEGLALDVGG
jgi:hypothetical protein